MLLLLVAFFATYGNAAGRAGGTSCEAGQSNAAKYGQSADTYTHPTMNKDRSEAFNLPSNGNYAPNKGTKTELSRSDLKIVRPDWREDKVEEGNEHLHEYGGSCTCPSGKVYQVSTYDFNGRCGKFACLNGVAGACHKSKGEWSYRSVKCASLRRINENAKGFNSISKLFDGYNILYGNPLPFDEPLDPGFTHQIFQSTYNEERQTFDNRFMVPDDVDAEICQSTCRLSMTAEVLRTEADYQNTMKDSVKWDAFAGGSASIGPFSAGFSAAFSGSNDYQTINKGFNQQQSQYVMSTATCCSYNIKHQNGGSRSTLDEGFVNDVWNLPTDYEENAYVQFVERYGTHYVKEVTMGSKFVEIDRITKEDMNSMAASHENVKSAAEVKACAGWTGVASFQAGGGYGSSHSTSNNNQNAFQNSIAQQHVVTLGALPPKDSSSGKAWTEVVVNNPQPIAVELGDISYVLSETFKDSYHGMNPVDLKQRKANLEKYIRTYCQTMKNNGRLAENAQCPCDTMQCCNSRDDDYNKCEMLSINDFCRKRGACVKATAPPLKAFSSAADAGHFRPLATPPPRPNFALVDGGPGSDKSLQEVRNPNPNQQLGEVQCCKESKCTRRDPWDSRKSRDCMSGHNDDSKFTLQEAKDMCASLGHGWTLCTRWEVSNKRCNKKGCQHDSAYVWVLERPERSTQEVEQAVARGYDDYAPEIGGSDFAADEETDGYGSGFSDGYGIEEIEDDDVAVVDGHLESEKSVAASYELPTRVSVRDKCKGTKYNAIPKGEQWILVERDYSWAWCGFMGFDHCDLCISPNNPLAHQGRCGWGSWTEAYEDCGGATCRSHGDCHPPGKIGPWCNIGIPPSASCSSSEVGESESMMAAQIADNKVNVALGFFAVIGGCAIMYNAVQLVRKYACEQQWTPIGEEDV